MLDRILQNLRVVSLEVSEKFAWVGGMVVGCWIIESLCLPIEAFCDLYVTFLVLVKVKVTIKC